jgi:6-phosphogluconolactonase
LHVAFAPSGRFLYLVNELNSTLAVFSFDPQAGSMRPAQTVSTLPETYAGASAAAEIALDAAGRVVYVSNRGHDSIAWFRVDPASGRLSPGEWIASGGRTPRHLALDPSGAWLLAANQDSDNLSFFRIDQASGGLSAGGRPLTVPDPVCLVFAASA